MHQRQLQKLSQQRAYYASMCKNYGNIATAVGTYLLQKAFSVQM